MILPVLALGMLFSTNATAQDAKTVEKETAMVSQVEQDKQKEDMKKIEISDVPQAVQDAVAKDFAGATITEAHAAENKNKYKLVVAVDGQNRTLYADANGNWIDKKNKS